MRILVTGATGNVGRTVIDTIDTSRAEIFAGARNRSKAEDKLEGRQITYCSIDFEKGAYPSVNFDAVFLIRPPQLTDPDLFERFLRSLHADTKIVFLSVEGAGRRSYLPHSKIEKVIEKLGFRHLFIRPGYFMENLTTTLWEELKKNNRIFLPAGRLEFNWVAISDIAQIASRALLEDLEESSVVIGGSERYNFNEAVAAINRICGTEFIYESPNLLHYVFYSIKKGKSWSYIFVMLLLHYLPRYGENRQRESSDYKRLTDKELTTLEEFIREHAELFGSLNGN